MYMKGFGFTETAQQQQQRVLREYGRRHQQQQQPYEYLWVPAFRRFGVLEFK